MKQRLHALGIGITVLSMMLPMANAVASESYKVSKGDTLWGISKKYGVSIDDIKRTNNLSANRPLKIGVKLTIPSTKKDSEVKSSENSSTPLDEKEVRRFGPRIAKQLVEARENESSTDAGKSEVVRTALSYRGARYVRGGVGSRGFDCSGFTRHVYSKHGINLPHSSRTQATCGKSVEKKDLQPGDLVFFATRRQGISHVGLYIGNNRFIHASTPSTGVIISSLSQGYYASRYRGARRVKTNK
ncbi:MAG: NlpC/P60 family protein [Armatimonadota bacterium]